MIVEHLIIYFVEEREEAMHKNKTSLWSKVAI
jgi:hypothetical protein